MTRLELFIKIKQAKSLRIHDKINSDMIINNIGDARFYKDMDASFLKDIKEITGVDNGIETAEYYIRFIVKGADTSHTDPIDYFVLSFHRHSREFNGISDIVYKADLELSSAPIIASYAEERDSILQLKNSIEQFISKARNKGFMIEATK